MKWLRLLLAGAGSLLAAGAAKAADLAPILKAPPPAASMPAFSWTGCYAGLNGGGAWGRQADNPRSAAFTPASNDIHSQGAMFGGQIGCDQQFGGNWVIGLEGELDGAHIAGQQIDPLGFGNPAYFVQANTRWLGSVTGRLGFAGLFPHTLVYVKGGGAWASERYNVNSYDSDLSGVFDQTVGGWTVGGGVALAIDSHWSVFAEYDHYDFSGRSFTDADMFGESALSINGPRLDVVQVGINYRFLGR
jgi:outer membrane immunogenic protein